MSDKAKSNELYDLCEQLLYDKASFDDIQEWFDNNKDNDSLLIQAANYRDKKYNLTLLHNLVMRKPPADLVMTLLKLAPDTIKVQDIHGRLPLHTALW